MSQKVKIYQNNTRFIGVMAAMKRGGFVFRVSYFRTFARYALFSITSRRVQSSSR